MFGSKNDFFKQDHITLRKARADLIALLRIKGRTREDVEEYLKAYDYFVVNPEEFDGATIVKDLVDVKTNKGCYLDSDAMLHDYEYIKGANKNFTKKWKSDKKYIIGMEKNGKGVRITRFVILTLTGILFVPYKHIIDLV